MMEKKALYEGKAKIMYATENPDELLVYYKDDATAGNGAKKGTISDKGIMNNKMTAFFFDLLAKNGIEHHYISMPSDREMLVKKLADYSDDTEDIEQDFYRTETGLGHIRQHNCRHLTGQHPGIADDLQPDADGGDENGQDAEEHLRFIRIHLQPVEGPDGGIAQIAEYEGGGDLHQVGDLEPAAQNGRLDEDEHDVHHPRQGPDGEETPLEIHDGGRAGNGSRTQIGFQGEGHADSHENQSEAGNGIALQEIFGFGFHRFDNFRICRQATSAGLRSWRVRFHRLWP